MSTSPYLTRVMKINLVTQEYKRKKIILLRTYSKCTFTQIESEVLIHTQVGCMLSMTFITILRHNHVVLYLGTAIYGLFMSSVAPSTISMAEQYIDVNCECCCFIV